MKTLSTIGKQLKASNQAVLGKQEDMRSPLGIAGSQRQHRLQARIIQLLGIINQQIDFLAGCG